MDFNIKVIKHTQVPRDSVLSLYVTFNATTLYLLLSGIKADTKVPPRCSFSPLLLTSICSFSTILGSKPKGRSDKMGIALQQARFSSVPCCTYYLKRLSSSQTWSSHLPSSPLTISLHTNSACWRIQINKIFSIGLQDSSNASSHACSNCRWLYSQTTWETGFQIYKTNKQTNRNVLLTSNYGLRLLV